MMTTNDTSLTAALGRAQFGRLTTFRRNGQAVSTPIWFADRGGKAVFVTGPRTGKAKRMRRSPQVKVGRATARGKLKGQEVNGTARLLSGDEAIEARNLLLAKYGVQFRVLQLIQLITRATPVYYEVSAA